ncbi:GCN5 family acetyltransferase [Intrasporangium oryzae NRRL B-24470]|uniref:GCN5 family acetyltransferase n=1 Tax=Intrasporangium oryzae NRRL B-24470 TaxID=1386089 RepID=W9G2W2_9MICO|nr:GNAT family N-acetyltransferase [Intrasporangium oryzae]EWT00340.1 GCN5 family acetyltransferase [Intrasporangium oryzae NRRL B-24470]
MPPSSPTFAVTSEAAEAKAWFEDLIAADPMTLSVVASVTDSLVADPTRYENPRWWAMRVHGEVVAAFMHTPPHPLHVGLATTGQARQLAAELAGAGGVLPGASGVRAPAEAFAQEWATRTGARLETVMEVGAFDLPERPVLPWVVPGHYRVASVSDLPLVDRWAQDFSDAVERHPTPAPTLEPAVGAGRVGLWVDGDRPVSMAYCSVVNGGVTRVSGVWTPPGHRGRGYASGVVAALSAERMDAGERCMLYTDLANPTSNKIYQALGYRRIGDNVSIAFSG